MNSKIIYDAAAKYLGTREVPGPGTNPTIKSWIRAAAKWLDYDDSSTPWCGCFRGGIGMETGTGVPAEHYRAKNWLKWGSGVHTIREAQKGDTVILVRKGGFHVALFDRLSGESVFLLGGNQSNSVCVAKFPVNQIEGIRRG